MAKSFGDRQAVQGVSFTVGFGECVGFLGPNGAGKSTTMRTLSCMSKRDAGDLTVLGMDPDRQPRALKRQLGVVAQEVNLDVELGVRENLVVYARYFDIPRQQAEDRADELLALVGLADRAASEVSELSGGMKRRLQVARALINTPRLVLLDEPTTGLDPRARQLLWGLLRQLRASGVALVLSTHYMDEAAQLCDRILIMDHGRIVAEGSPAELVQSTPGTAGGSLEDVFLAVTGYALDDDVGSAAADASRRRATNDATTMPNS